MLWKGWWSWAPKMHSANESGKVEMHLFEDSNQYRITPPPSNCHTFAFMPCVEESILEFLPMVAAIMQDLLWSYQTITIMSAMERRVCLTHSQKIETAMASITQWSLEHPQAEIKNFPIDGLELYSVTTGIPQVLTTHFMERSNTCDFYDIFAYTTKSDFQTIEDVKLHLSHNAFEIHMTYERYPDILYIDINKFSVQADDVRQRVENVIRFYCNRFGRRLIVDSGSCGG